MKKPINSVQLGVSRFWAEVTDRQVDKDLADWVRSFGRALAIQDASLNDYAKELILDVEEYRRNEAERKRRHREIEALKKQLDVLKKENTVLKKQIKASENDL